MIIYGKIMVKFWINFGNILEKLESLQNESKKTLTNRPPLMKK